MIACTARVPPEPSHHHLRTACTPGLSALGSAGSAANSAAGNSAAADFAPTGCNFFFMVSQQAS